MLPPKTNRSIALFGESVRRFFRDQRRSEMTSPMFNLPGRLLLGSHCYYENLPELLSELLRHTSPEAIGHSMRQLCNRPNYVHLNSLALGYLVGREQARLSGTCDKGDDSATASVMDFWARAARHYRSDGHLLPDEASYTVPILEAGTICDIERRLRIGVAEPLRRQIHRMLATVELYTFILHGEARVGVFHHGPYPLQGGESLIVKELVGLQEDFYPWTRAQIALPCNNIACVMRVRDVRSSIVLFGSLTTEPRDYVPSITAEAVFAVADGVYHPLPDEQLPVLTKSAADAQLELYRRVMDWDERYRIQYGADLYAYLLKSFAEPLGFGAAFADRIRERFRHSVKRHLEDLYSGQEQPTVLHHIASTDGPIFSPVTSGKVDAA